MRFTELEPRPPRTGTCNFSYLLEALEKLHPNDEELTEKLRELDWEEPLHIVKRFKMPGSSQTEAVTEFVSPMTVLLRMQNRRLLDAALKEDMLPKEQTHYSDQSHMRWTYGREGLWRHELNEAFAMADWRSAQRMIPWGDCGDRSAHFARDWSRSPLAHLCYRSHQANPADLEQCVKLGLKTLADEIIASPSGRQDPKIEARERVAQALDAMLSMAASNANEAMCKTLVSLGARHSRHSLFQTFAHGLFDAFWEGLAFARANPEAFFAASKAEREDRDQKLSPLLGSLCETVAQGVQSAIEAAPFRREAESYEMSCFKTHKARVAAELAKALEDGLALPGVDPSATQRDQVKALAQVTRTLEAFNEPGLAEVIDRCYPKPIPEEFGSLIFNRDSSRFKQRAQTALEALDAGAWGEEQRVLLAQELKAALDTAGKASQAARGKDPEREAKALRALDLLAWIEAKAPALLPTERPAQTLLAESAMGDSANRTQYLMRLESEVLDLTMDRGAPKPFRPRKA